MSNWLKKSFSAAKRGRKKAPIWAKNKSSILFKDYLNKLMFKE